MTLDTIAARLDNAAAILAAASRAGVDLALACALAEKESAGRNIYGHDSGGTYSTRDAEVALDGVTYPRGSDVPVTEANFTRFTALVASGAKSNGVGPAQITYRGYFPDAERRGLRLWLPEDNLTFGLQIIARHLSAGRSIAEAGTLYNTGNLTAGVTAYGRDLETKTDTWRARLATPPTGGTMTYDFTRAQWGARPADYVNALDWAKVAHLIVHYPGTAGTIGTGVDELARRLRGWQDRHMDGRGWSDIAYNVAVDQLGRVWELRGWDRRDGATKGMGGVSFSILGMVGNTQEPSDAMRATILRLLVEGNSRAAAAKRGWHSMYASTSCPGDALRAWGRDGFPAPGIVVADPLGSVTPKPAPAPTASAPDWPLDNGCHKHGTAAYFGPREPLSNARSVSGYYTHREDLRTWQRRMRERGWAIEPDGLYGDETAGVARRFQREKGLAADGLIGRDTWRASWELPVT